MSDHDQLLLAAVKAEGRRRKRLRIGALAAGVAAITVAGVVSVGGSHPEQQVQVAAPRSTTIAETPQATSTTDPDLATTTSRADVTTTTVAPGDGPPPSTTTTTAARADAPVHGTTRHAESGLTFTLVSESVVFGRNERVSFSLMVTNDSGEPRVYDASPGPRFELVQNGARRWDEGCGAAYPAVFHTEKIAPGQTLTFRSEYPSTCPVAPGAYGLTGIFSWCPATQPRESCERIAIEPIALTIVE